MRRIASAMLDGVSCDSLPKNCSVSTPPISVRPPARLVPVSRRFWVPATSAEASFGWLRPGTAREAMRPSAEGSMPPRWSPFAQPVCPR